ncbi:nuclear transport factor 2 family protein [Pseudonocardia nematodicida]|uniref:Nuclear transport factor 2 family protein n=1 Tax=Pseudonocardia nematodicida TaxID=1206997 RepID=A0ABV1K5E1_9PSEU
MSRTPPLALDRYLAASDRAIADHTAMDELLDVFAPEAVVQIDDTPIRGAEAIREFYRGYVNAHVASQHFWNTTVLTDGRQRAEWVCAARTAGGAVITVAGVEHATIGPDDRIVELRNEFTRPPA